MKPWRIGLVVPRYGESILGGAEALARGLAEQLVAHRLAEVEVFTTCARDHITWQNEFPAGLVNLRGVPVRRFPVDHKQRDLKLYTALHQQIIQGERLPAAAQYAWIAHSAHSPLLYAHLEKYGATFDFLIFIPYLFGPTYYGSAIWPNRSVLWPCLHDEVYAYLEPTRQMVRACRGVMFNSAPEMRLADRLYGRHPGGQVVGFGLAPVTVEPERFRQSAGHRAPFMLYAGRLESAKNVPLLVDYFLEYKRQRGGDLQLALMGQGPVPLPKHPALLNLDFRQGQAKLEIYAAATLLCQPSVNESFSIVIMESWLSRVPVLVHGACEVTRYHVERSQGGLYFSDYEEFAAVLDWFLDNPALARQMGQNGYAYVQTNYNWPVVLDRFMAALEIWKGLLEETAL